MVLYVEKVERRADGLVEAVQVKARHRSAAARMQCFPRATSKEHSFYGLGDCCCRPMLLSERQKGEATEYVLIGILGVV